MRKSADLALFLAVALAAVTVGRPAVAEPVSGPRTVLQPGAPRVVSLVVDDGGSAPAPQVERTESGVKASLNSGVSFDRDSVILLPQARARLAEVATELRRYTPGAVQVIGYTDDLGSHEHGVKVSTGRAAAVKAALEPSIPGFAVTAEGRAEANPVAPNDSEENRAKNRRVDIIYTGTVLATPTPTLTHSPSARPSPSTRTPTPSVPAARTSTARELRGPDGRTWRVEVRPVRRNGDLVEVTFGLSTNNAEPVDPTPLVGEGANAVTLSNGPDRPRLEPATTTDGRAACLPAPTAVRASAETTCFYAVPETAVVDVSFGSTGVVSNIPVMD